MHTEEPKQAHARSHVKPHQISEGPGAACALLILAACLQSICLRPGLAFQQLL